MQITTPDPAATRESGIRNARRADLIFVNCALEAQSHADTPLKLYERRKTRGHEADALWGGYIATRTENVSCIQAALERGQLLYCFEGSTALQGRAA